MFCCGGVHVVVVMVSLCATVWRGMVGCGPPPPPFLNTYCQPQPHEWEPRSDSTLDSQRETQYHGFLYQTGQFVFVFPGTSYGKTFGINNAGMIVGIYGDSSNLSHGFSACA